MMLSDVNGCRYRRKNRESTVTVTAEDIDTLQSSINYTRQVIDINDSQDFL